MIDPQRRSARVRGVQTDGCGNLLEGAVAQTPVELIGNATGLRHEDIDEAIAVVIRCRDPRADARLVLEAAYSPQSPDIVKHHLPDDAIDTERKDQRRLHDMPSKRDHVSTLARPRPNSGPAGTTARPGKICLLVEVTA